MPDELVEAGLLSAEVCRVTLGSPPFGGGGSMTGLEHAILGLRQALDSPRRHHSWRWLVRHRMAGVKDALTGEAIRDTHAWLAARGGAVPRGGKSPVSRL